MSDLVRSVFVGLDLVRLELVRSVFVKLDFDR